VFFILAAALHALGTSLLMRLTIWTHRYHVMFGVITELASKFMAIAVFYSRKSFNPQVLFMDMSAAWGIPKLQAVQKVGDYTFKLEFGKRRRRVC
jgi:hypothetical protein